MAHAPDGPEESTSGDEPPGATGRAATGAGAHDAPVDEPGAGTPPAATSTPGGGETRPGAPPLPLAGAPVHQGMPGPALQGYEQGYEQAPGWGRVPPPPTRAVGGQRWQAAPGHVHHPGPSWPGQGHLPPAGPAWPAPRPGVVPLRPLAGGDVLAGAFRFLVSHPLLAFGVTAVCVALGVGGSLLALPVLAVLPDLEVTGPARSVVAVGWAALHLTATWIVLVITAAVGCGMLVVALLGAVAGRRTGIVAAGRAIAPRLPGLIGLHLVIALVFLVVFLAALGSVIVTAHLAPDAVSVPLPLVGALALLIALAVHLAVLWVRAPAAYVLEPIGAAAALARSRRLTRGAWWSTFGVLLLVGLLVAVLAVVVPALAAAGGLLPEAGVVVVATIALPLVTAVGGLLYVDQRIRRERFDLALLPQAG